MVSIQRRRTTTSRFKSSSRYIIRLVVLTVLTACLASWWIRVGEPLEELRIRRNETASLGRGPEDFFQSKNPNQKPADSSAPLKLTEKDAFASFSQLNQLLLNGTLQKRFHFLTDVLRDYKGRLLDSDIVMLRHCSLDTDDFDWNLYVRWASHILDQLVPGIMDNPQQQAILTAEDIQLLEEEFVLELLEVFATHQGHCRFHNPHLFPGSPAVWNEEEWNQTQDKLKSVVLSASPPSDEATLAIVIVAFQDAEHLARLVEALHRPQHVIVIHVERRAPAEYVTQVKSTISDKFDNVVIIQFGTVTYRTDSISLINLQIIKWLVVDMAIQYDYHVTIGGAVYPLYGAKELARHLHQAKLHHRHVWLGELTGGRHGARIRSMQYDYLERPRFSYTRGTSLETKVAFRVKQKLLYPYTHNESIVQIPTEIQVHMMFKTNSGNQAVYSYDTVEKLLHTPDVLRLFSMAKYGCCCCLEERTWIAAMGMIGLREESLRHGAMWQVWGGLEECSSSMNNALLSNNASLCYRVEDMTTGVSRQVDKAWYIQGNQIPGLLKDAKSRGFLFARKFKSSDLPSTKLLDEMRQELHA